jgi:hypothetical protein
LEGEFDMRVCLFLFGLVFFAACTSLPTATRTRLPPAPQTIDIKPTLLATVTPKSVSARTSVPTRRATEAASKLLTPTPTFIYHSERCQPNQKWSGQGFPVLHWDDVPIETPSFDAWTVYSSTDGIIFFTDDWYGYQPDQGTLRYRFEHPSDWQWHGGVLVNAEGIKVAERVGPICLQVGQTCYDNFVESALAQEAYILKRFELLSVEDWRGKKYWGKRVVRKNNMVDRKNHPRFGTGHVPDVIFITTYCLQDEEKAFLIWFYAEDELTSEDSALYERIVSTFRFVDP